MKNTKEILINQANLANMLVNCDPSQNTKSITDTMLANEALIVERKAIAKAKNMGIILDLNKGKQAIIKNHVQFINKLLGL
tara:strand:- start:739 stop:981 length:243 start_codon:yes stop_codon:yes gene_type:complete